jgi:photosystem II stability/assembly factor-like uncharacterized protein
MRRTVLAFAFFVSTPLFAADPARFQELSWRLIGPFRGGRVLAVTGVQGEPEHFYFGSVNGGVWETKDAGRTWDPIFDSQPVGSIGAIAVAPSNPKVIYVGTGEADMRSDIAQGEGMFKSLDAGKTWTRIGLTDSQQIARIIVDPSNPDVAYVAALGHPYASNEERGVYRTRDGGSTWQKLLGDRDLGAVDLAFEPGNAQVVYAAMWQTRRTPWSVYAPSNGPRSGLFKSTDGGDHWTESKLTPKPGRIGVAIAPSEPRRVYAVVDAPEGGVYQSDDAGATWTRAASDTRVWSRGWYFGGITVEPKNADVVYSCNINLYRSTDGGKTFVPVKGAPGGDDYHALWIDPTNSDRRILGVDQGTLVSINGGKTWSSWYNQPTGQFYHVVTDSRFPYWVYGSQQDSGAAGVPSRTWNIDGINLTNFRESTAGGESDNVAPDPADPDILYGGRVDKLNLKTMQTQSIDPMLAHPGNDRHTWTLPLVFSPRNPKALYFSNQRVFRTMDGGQHWDVISPDLTRENPEVPANLDPVTAANRANPGPRQGVVYAIAPSRMTDRDIWVGTDDGLIWRTRDDGAHWQNITPAAVTAWSKIGIIEASHFDAETAYVAVDRHRLDDFRPYVYRTRDGGKSWQLIASGLPTTVNVVREDPVRKGLLYAGTERGVAVSFDDGEHWQPLQMNLPATSVRDIDVHRNDLVIATHGRAFWIMDDISPLRNLEAKALFPPATAVRFRPAGFTGTPMPKDEPMAPNPPNGAFVDYIISTPTTGPVTLEIFDAKDQLVRRLSSADPVRTPNLAKLNTALEWFVTAPVLKTTPGMHRVYWTMRYAAPESLATGRGGGEGVWAPPGTYNVVMTMNGQKYSEKLTIAPDPRITLPASAYSEQFALARDVEQTRATIATALEAAKTLISDAGTRADIVERAKAISGATTQTGFPLPVAEPGTLRFIGDALSKLQSAVDGADAAPTPDARTSWSILKPAADAALKAWGEFRK